MSRIIAAVLAFSASMSLAQAVPAGAASARGGKHAPAIKAKLAESRPVSAGVGVCGTPANPTVGSPSHVYLNYLKATKNARSFDEIKIYIDSARLKEMENSPMASEALAFCQANVAQNVKIIAEKVEGKKATVFIEGKQSFFGAGTPELSTGTISMVQENGSWKIEKEGWKIGSSGGGAQRVSEVEWSQQALTASDKKTEAQGTVHGFAIAPSVVRLNKPKSENELTELQFSDATFTMFPSFGFSIEIKDADVQGKEYVMSINDDGRIGFVHTYWSSKNTGDPAAMTIFTSNDGVGLKLKFGTEKDGVIPGTITLRCPDKEKSHLEGTFKAQIK